MIAPECLSGDRSTHSRVASLVELRFGDLETAHLVAIPKGKIRNEVPAYEYKPLRGGPVSTFSRAMADYVVLSAAEVEEGDGLELVFQGFNGGTKKARVHPVDQQDGPRVIKLVVVNRPSDSNKNPKRRERAKHFEVFYELSRRTTMKHHRPVPWPHPDKGIDGTTVQACDPLKFARLDQGEKKKAILAGVGRPICPQAQFSPEPVSDTEASSDGE
jgi:hypothetical protein